MKVFITKYAQDYEKPPYKKAIEVEYNTEIECNIIAGSNKRVIDIEEKMIELTGSLKTDATTDPTRDEATDR